MLSLSLRALAPRTLLLLQGPDRKRFLHGMVTNDIQGLSPGQGCHAALLTVKGKMLADLVVYDLGERGLLLEAEGLVRESVRDALERHLIMDDVTITDLGDSWDAAGVYGGEAAAALSGVAGATLDPGLPLYHFVEVPGHDVIVARTPDLGVPGFHVLGPRERVAALIERLAGHGARALPPPEAEVLRVEAGVPRYGTDMDEERLPIEANLDDAVSYTKGCYLGQEVIARLVARGHVNRKLVGLRFPAGGPPPPRGTELRHPDKANAGTVMSGVVSPRHGTIALAYVHRTLWQPGTELRAGPEPGTPAVVTPLPFTGT